MLNKENETWSNAPFWVKQALWSISTRKTALAYEVGSAVVGLMFFIASFLYEPLAFGTVLFGAAYWYAAAIRWVDNAGLWADDK